MPVLRFRKASKSYQLVGHSVPALREVTVDIEAGQFVAILGRSGCGKSTFLNLAGAMDLPSEGEVRIDGFSTSELADEDLTRIRRHKVGFVFQFFRLFPTLSAIENVEVPLQLAGGTDPRSRAMEMLEWVGLAELGDRLPHQLSGGQMQRVAIARALGPAPSVLLADEPTGNLDSETSGTIMELFRRVNTGLGTAIVMATHSLENAAHADRVLSMRDGRLVSDEAGAMATAASDRQ